MAPQPLLTVRAARVAELDTVLALLQQRIEWLRSRGSDQWSTWEQWRTKIRPSLERGQVWFLMSAGDLAPIGTITVEFHGDSDFWTAADQSEPSAYLSKLAVRLDHAGDELGTLLMDWASDYAYRRGCRYLRLDAWKKNEDLHAYYLSRGWTHLRTVDNSRRHSGALFQTVVRPLSAEQQQRVGDGFATNVLEPTVGGPAFPDADEQGNWQPSHIHRGALKIDYDVHSTPREAWFLDFMRYRVRQADGVWLFESVDRHFTSWHREGVVVNATEFFQPGMIYILTHQERPAGDCRVVVVPLPSELSTGLPERP